MLYSRLTTCATTAGIMSCSISFFTLPLPISCFACAMDVILLFTSNLNYLFYIILKTRKNTSPFLQNFPYCAKKRVPPCRSAGVAAMSPLRCGFPGGSGLCIQVFGDMSVKKQGFSSGLCLVHSGIFQYNKEAEKKNKRCDQNGSPRCFVFCGAAAPGEKRSAVQ